jgi:hypothetical protein
MAPISARRALFTASRRGEHFRNVRVRQYHQARYIRARRKPVQLRIGIVETVLIGGLSDLLRNLLR